MTGTLILAAILAGFLIGLDLLLAAACAGKADGIAQDMHDHRERLP